jgi:hypothetical protein
VRQAVRAIEHYSALAQRPTGAAGSQATGWHDVALRKVSAVNTALGALPDSEAKATPDHQKKLDDARELLIQRAREFARLEPVAASLVALFEVAALRPENREWFPVDPELASVRDSIIVPAKMTDGDEPEPPATAATAESDDELTMLLKRLLAQATA